MKNQIFNLFRRKILLISFCLLALFLCSSNPLVGDASFELPQQSLTCSWNGNVYTAGEIFLNQSGQQYLCNSDGTISYIGITPNYPAYPNPAPDLNYTSYPLGYYGYYSNSPNVLVNSLYSTYQTMAGTSASTSTSSSSSSYYGYTWTSQLSPVNTYSNPNPSEIVEPVAAPAPSPPNNLVSTVNYPLLEYYEQTCTWHGVVYTPGQKFCNSACQEYVCNSDGTIVWTGYETTETSVAPTCPYCVHYVEATQTN